MCVYKGNNCYFVEGKTQNTDNDSPVWVPDSEATLCMHCKKSQFTLINRRVSKQTDVLSNSYFDIEWGLRKIHGDFKAFQIFGLKYIMKWWLRCIQIHLDTFMVLKISIIWFNCTWIVVSSTKYKKHRKIHIEKSRIVILVVNIELT